MAHPFSPIAIVGQACLLPGAPDPDELWRAVASGRDLLGHAPAGRWGLDPDLVLTQDPAASIDRSWSDRGGYVSGFEARFDADGFAVPAEEISALDLLFQWTLHVGRAALVDAGHDPRQDAPRVGAVMGNLSFPSEGLARFAEAVWFEHSPRPHPLNRFMSGMPAHLLARSLRLGAGAFALDAACASSLYAIKLACDRLHDGSADLMLAGAVNRADDLFIHVGFCALQALSRSGRSRPFHADADGLVPAEGAAFVVLKRLPDAESAGDRILGVIRGVGLSNDGRGAGFLAPAEEGQRRAMDAAYAMSGLRPQDVSLLECHATGTPVGDAVELRSTAAIFAGLEGVPIGSLKSNIGHLVTVAGSASLLKVLGALRAGVRPPTLHADEPLAALAGSPFRLLREAEPWNTSGPRRAGISAFGFGGNNAHLLVEEWTPSPRSARSAAPATTRGAGPPIAIVAIATALGDDETPDALRSALLPLEVDNAVPHSPAAEAVSLEAPGLRFPPRDLEQALAQQLLVLRAAREAVAQAGALPRERTGVLVGMQCDAEVARYGARWRLAQQARERALDDAWLTQARDAVCAPLQSAGVVGTMPNVVANRLNSQLDLGGPSFTVSSEELSGIVALQLASRALAAGELDAAVVGAVDVCAEPVHAEAARACLPPGRHLPGDAAVVLVLRRAEDARRDGQEILARLDDAGSAPGLRLGLGAEAMPLTPRFGHAHAASGLLHVAAAALACRHGARPDSVAGRPAWPWLEREPVAEVVVEALGGARARARVAAAGVPEGLRAREGRRIRVYSGADVDEVRDALARGDESHRGPSRLAVVTPDRDAAAVVERAHAVLAGRLPSGGGIHYFTRPVNGELGFVFSGPAGAYRGMGRDLLLARPDLVAQLAERFAALSEAAGWAWSETEQDVSPEQKLWGSSALCQVQATLSQSLLGRPAAAIGFCSGETNALYALGAWDDFDGLYHGIRDAGIYTHELAGEHGVLRRAWGEANPRWANWRVLAPLAEIREAIADEPRVHLTTIHAPGDGAIGGDAEACERVIGRLGAQRARPQGYDLSIHCPELAGFASAWRALHDRETATVDDVRFYSHASLGHYQVSRDSAADALVGQALRTVDFPALVDQAWQDGVRVFVEHGPQAGCTRWISRILGDREHVAVALDVAGESALPVLGDAMARLVAAGVALDLDAVNDMLRAAPASPRTDGALTFPAHRPAPRLLRTEAGPTTMPRAPELPPVLLPVGSRASMRPARERPQPLAAGPGHTAVSATATGTSWPEPVARLVAAQGALAQAHREFLTGQAEAHQRFLEMRRAPGEPASVSAVAAPMPLAHTPKIVPPALAPRLPSPSPPPTSEPHQDRGGTAVRIPTPRGPRFSRQQLEQLASGRISEVFGPLFERQDGFRRQVRMPEPPLLLADRVVGIDGEAGGLGKGTIWTETDIAPGAWYLHEGRMPAGIMIESGQADLLLISWLGIDFHNRGERVYRLLGCDLTYHGGLPRPDDTLRYDIHVDGHARQDDIRLFFFHYDCRVGDAVRLSVRNGQAGFFSDRELAETGGVLWDAETAERTPDARIDPPRVTRVTERLDADRLPLLSEGRLRAAFGDDYALSDTQVAPPRLADGKMRLLHEISHIDPAGGAWQRGYLRANWRFSEADWFFAGHFKNDPCMPGTLMFEGCLQAMAAYMMALGLTLDRDGWRFEPVPDTSYRLRCRGQALPDSRELAYEVFVDELVDGPEPTLWADLLCSVDGTKAFHCRRMGLRLVPGWPLEGRPKLLPERLEAPGVGGRWDSGAVLACAWGRPSDAFGPAYTEFDGPRRLPRLPGPPYHFMSEVRLLEGDRDTPGPGARIEAAWDFDARDWYFDAQGHEHMPFSVLLEALLQPCGWLALQTGIPLRTEEGLYFRNLDGTGRILRHLTRGSGRLKSRVQLKSLSASAGMWLVTFDVDAALADGPPIMSLTTGFGFFPQVALEQQVGLPALSGVPESDLDPGLAIDLGGTASTGLATRRPLLMIDRLWDLRAGSATGTVIAEKDVDPADWFFKAHFFQDPVQPGSLGLEMMIQTLQLAVARDVPQASAPARFEPLAIDQPLTWKYRGQVLPGNRQVRVTLDIQEVREDAGALVASAEGSLFVDGLRIYHATGLTTRLAR